MFVVIYILLAINIFFLSFEYISFRLNGEGINDSVFYHILNPIDGVGFYEFKFELFIVFVVFLFIFSFYFLIRKNKTLGKYNLFLSSVFFIALFFNPGVTKTFGYFKMSYFDNFKKPDDYVDFKFNKTEPRNLFFVYLESLENTYTDEKIFPGLTPNIKYYKNQALSFENLKMPTGSEWTIAGMVASQCGIPLVTSSGSGNSMGQAQKFLPNANCLGDILKNNGYANYYYGGADTKFAGKKNFYTNHGFDNIFGLDELKNRAEVNAHSSWGIYDDELFDIVKNDFEKIDKNKKYSWFTLNLDTHHPFGHVSPSCEDIKYRDGDIKILNAVHCTDYLLRNFVDNVMVNDPQAIIVIASDHLAMPNDAKEILVKQDRRNLFLIMGSQISAQRIDDSASTYDIAPTVLSLMGFDGEGLGWGRNLLKNKSVLSNFSDIGRFNDYVKSFHGFNQSFHGYHKKFNGLKKGDDFFELNDEKIKAPFAIKINNKNYIDDIFFPGEGGFEVYLKNVIELNLENNIIYVDECGKINLNYSKNKDFCYLISNYRWIHDKGGVFTDDVIIDKNFDIVSWGLFDKIENNLDKYIYRDAEVISLENSISANSETFGEGESWVKTEKSIFYLNRGIGFYSFDHNGDVKNLDFKDFCNDSENATPSKELMDFLHGDISENNQFMYVVHDTAWCLKGKYDEFVKNINAPINLEDIDFREAAIFIQKKNGAEFKKSKKKVVLVSKNSNKN